MVGTFYRAPRPGAPPFVEAGGVVGPDDVVCIIEVMKLMSSITTGCRGRIVEILVDNGQLVEYGQPLMIVAPIPA
jgi:acetyl-CoA carboxylase biotin carboxyl carrier protein